MADQQYFEGILQLRNSKPEILEFIRKDVDNKDKVFIAKEEKVRGGTDLYLSSQRYLQTLGKKLQKQFGGEMVVSTRLHTTNRLTSKLVYRVYVLFRLPLFKKGDIIQIRGDKYKVISIGKKVFAQEVVSGKKVTFDYKSIPDNLH